MNEKNNPPSTPGDILVVDDTPDSLRLLTDLLAKHGYRVRPASDGALALKSVAARTPDLILLDISMPDMDGYETCRRLRADEKNRRIPIIFISAFGDTHQKVKGFEAGGVDYITKPFEAEEVLARVRTHLRLRRVEELQRALEEIEALKSQLELRNDYLQEAVVEAKAFGDLVGQSAPLKHIVSQIDVVAPTEASVLILGETGTGKELVAHEIHRRSARKNGPLVRVNCASIPRELFESEFFGHLRGAFTGAVKDRAGRFETAEGGTLFLDEVGEIPLDIQNKLLRVLQEKRYERVGEDRTRTANVRIVAATNRDLKQAVAAGRFREDLYYRLHVFPIQVVPLRERKDDIPLLAKHFMELSVKDLKCAKPRLTRAGVVKLQSYDWPGNVRELRNVIERAVILARGGSLEFDLPIQTAGSPLPAAKSRTATEATEADEPEFLTEAELQLRERDNLLRVLTRTNWKIKGPDGAAELLGVKPTTLLSRMDKWGLKKPATSN
jgi:DNA-binding NtrC family response regulator